MPSFNSPTPFPPSRIGDLDYYRFRRDDFLARNPGVTPPDYYMDYGDKYINRFSNDTFPHLSREGQDWLLRARANLQKEIEARLNKNPEGFAQLERNPDQFRDFA